MPLGFAGLGLMGRPMAANLRRAGVELVVYNRSAPPRMSLTALGARAVGTPDVLFETCDAVILMLADEAAVEAVLGRAGQAFTTPIKDRLIINMGTHDPAWSRTLAADVEAAGGAFVEAPVSGSRLPAERAELVAMLAGRKAHVERAARLIAPMCRQIVPTGETSALALKMAVNLYLMTTVTALAEAAHLARALNLDLAAFQAVIGAGQLRSDVAVTKLHKMVAAEFSAQATIADVCKNARLVAETAKLAGAPCPLLDESRRRFEAILTAGGATLDMAIVIETFADDRFGAKLAASARASAL